MISDGVFEGGGVRGIAHVGAVIAMEENGYKWDRLAGTSAGSIIAALLACGYSGSELKEIINSLDYKKFIKKNWIHKIPFIGGPLNLWKSKGLYSNCYESEWLEDLLSQKGIKNFSDLDNGKLKIVVSDITNGRMAIIPDDLEYYDESLDFSVAKAVQMSSTIPFFFQPFKWSTKKNRLPCYFVDGGLLSNFPIWIFDSTDTPKQPTIGFHLVKDEVKAKSISETGVVELYKSIFRTMMQAHDLRHFNNETQARTIKIPTGNVTSTKFNLSVEERQWLFNSGYQAATSFLETWDFNVYKNLYRNSTVLKN
ncbi:patatin-like phospholipase family protein [Cytobacillus sp. FSL H8-0458]|uniref:patatin-like phospholipase family protein n=1 Tax=Cytobacillus sp. FSL H8-0458 TaxID=2975346 RepID=UPI0030F62B4E